MLLSLSCTAFIYTSEMEVALLAPPETISGRDRYFEVPLDTFRYFEVLLCTLRYIYVLLCTSRYFEVLPGNLGYLCSCSFEPFPKLNDCFLSAPDQRLTKGVTRRKEKG